MSPSDVTVVVATLTGDGEDFRSCIQSILACCPKRIYIVTPDENVVRLRRSFNPLSTSVIEVIGVERANKRLQMIQGLIRSETAITIFADDDVIWQPTFLIYLLAAFEDPSVGAAGTCQRLRRVPNPGCWNILGAFYLERRNFEISATTHIDGGTACLSGRTSAHRTHILLNRAFIEGFANEVWLGYIPLGTADDDNFLTRWMVNHGWKIKIQYCKEAELQTTFTSDARFLDQCARWSRTTWRSNITSMFIERRIWR